MDTTKPFYISKQVVVEAYKRVKANKGSAGVDEVSMGEFEKDLRNNLYKIWNRMSSGSYFPPPVKIVEIPKGDGKMRTLGIPTISDRIAQMVAKLYLEPVIDPLFHEDSYGYRPGKSAINAVDRARTRCWKYDYVIDLDIKGFFDNLDHELIMKAVQKHTKSKWMLTYIERWLKAPAQNGKGDLINREKGTPQGGVISPLLANLFLHYALDEWMKRNHPSNPFERYADDVVVHCKTEVGANNLRKAIEKRLNECKLELHPEKTKIVYCKDANRKGSYSNEKFDFLGYTFRPRSSKNRHGQIFTNFSPAVSNKAKTKMTQTMRKWKIHLRTGTTLGDLSKECAMTIRIAGQ
jgi:RNA-directed DNA polymerase